MKTKSAKNIDLEFTRHELKNYLMKIKAFCELIEIDMGDKKKIKEYLNKIDRFIDQADDFINRKLK